MSGARLDTNRRKLMERLPAEVDHGPILGVLATTYELDPDFLEADFLPALLGLGAWNDRSWASRVALERALGTLEATSVLLDQRHYRGRPRSLHVEVLPAVGAAGQLLHAKVLLVVHERAVRLQVASANLTSAGYRENREVALPLIATEDTPEAAAVVRDALASMPTLLAPWWTESAGAIHRLATEHVRTWAGEAPEDLAIVWGGAVEPLWKQVVARWLRHEPVQRISIVSPFWSEEGKHGPFATLVSALRGGGELVRGAEIDLYVEAETTPQGTHRPVIPMLGSLDPRALEVRIRVHAVQPLPNDEPGSKDVLKPRRLHAKVLLLHGPKTTLAYVGSANFTIPGWGFGTNPSRANIEAGVVVVREGPSLTSALLPPTTGKPVELDLASLAAVTPANDPEPVVPTFVRGVWLEPEPGNEQRLRLTVDLDAARIAGSFRIASADNSLVFIDAGSGTEAEVHVGLSEEGVNRLLRDQQVRISWWASADSCEYPVNVNRSALANLPTVPGAGNPDERLLLAYYQGRISLADLFPPPPGWEEEGDAEQGAPELENQVDTSRIQSYQVREFVEALQGIRDDLAAAARGTETSMRLAIGGPVSPLALARQVRNAARAGRRSATAAGFQLVEIALCLRDAALVGNAGPGWEAAVDRGSSAMNEMLEDLVRAAPVLGPKTSFARYAREVLGWRSKGGDAA